MQCPVLEVFSIFPIIGSCASVTGSWAAWVLLLHCMRTTLDEALAFPLPLRWSPLSWPSGHPMEAKHQPGKLGLDPVGPLKTLRDPCPWAPPRPSFLAILTSAGCHCIHAKMYGWALVLQSDFLGLSESR